jgi:hypothetical protein
MGSTSLRFQQAGQQYATFLFADHKTVPRNHTNPAYLISIQEFDFRETAISKNFLFEKWP